LVDKGNVRVQTLGGGAYLLGPGESFGERALITEQPHNTTVSADTDVDVWTLNKQDLDMLMNRYPGIAISITRIISQRMSETPAAAGGYAPAPAPVPVEAPQAAPSPAGRRAGSAASSAPWLWRVVWQSLWRGKLRFILLMLLLMIFLCVTIPLTGAAIISGLNAAGRAIAATLDNAMDVVSQGDVEVVAADLNTTERMRLADAMVPPTPTYTPFPTATPLPTLTPTPTNTPEPTATPEPVIVQNFVDVSAAAAPVKPPAGITDARSSRGGGGRAAQP
jgi:hypothetical protein